jgi:hypothetical protein
VQKLCLLLQKENEYLKTMLKENKHEKIEWVYAQDGCLFNVRENKKAVG